MPEVSSLFTGVQIGAETTPGTSVAASKLLNYLSLTPNPSLDFNTFRPMGSRVATAITPGKDFTTVPVSGAGTYSEFIYPFSSLFGTVTPTTVDTTAKLWTFTPPGRTEVTAPKTYTIESGSGTRAQKATYVFFRGIELTFNRDDGVAVGGEAIGQQIQDNIVLTASPTAIEDVPILPTHLNVYVDSTSGGIGATKETRCFEAVFRYNDSRDPVWPINATLASFGSDVEIAPTVQIELKMEADSTGMAELPNARAGTTRYIRLEAVSTALAGSTTAKYQLQIDMAGKVSAISDFEDESGIKAITYTFDAIYDAAWSTGRFLTIGYQNKTATL